MIHPIAPDRDRVVETAQAIAPAALELDPVFVEPLTRREHDVLEVLVQGASNQEIADTLVNTPNTVKRHVQAILGKLGVRNRTQAVARAQNLDLLATRQPVVHGRSGG